MNLILLDDTNTVIQTWIMLAHFQPLSDRYMFAPDSVKVGDVFDPVAGTMQHLKKRRWITRRSFRNRFTGTETAALELAESWLYRPDATADQRTIAAQLSAFQREVSDGPYVDLDLPEVQSGLAWLWYVAGIMDSEARIAEFLDGPIADHEYAPEA